MAVKIRTDRYVFHVAYNFSREGISKRGILSSSGRHYDDLVFAHNGNYPTMDWYPFCFDEGWSWNMNFRWVERDPETYFKEVMRLYGDGETYSGYDFWQIDTKKLGKQWYIDEPAHKDFGYWHKPLYVYCEGDIPADCIRLFQFHEFVRTVSRDGVTSVLPEFRPAESWYGRSR